MMLTAYLAGPDVFLPDPRAHAARKIAICARHGLIGRTPLNEDIARAPGLSDQAFAREIFRKDLAMMERCDIVIANLTPFRGTSADSGTLVELGWFLGRGKPILRVFQCRHAVQRTDPRAARGDAGSAAGHCRRGVRVAR